MTSSDAMLKLRDALVDIEHFGEQFLSTRAKMVDLDKQRNGVRQALTACRKLLRSDSKVVLDIGCGVQARLPKEEAARYLKQDQERLEAEMEAARKDLKRLTGLLADKGATPEDVGPGMLRAMLSLTDKRATERAQA